ncbi:MAG: GIY-YIG nuclease family protein [Patescibacteria group bacterium]
MLYSRQDYIALPENAGVYRFLDGQKKVIYVGKAKNLKSRVSSYFTNSGLLGPKTKRLVEKIVSINIINVESELEALLLEAFYIKQYHPKYNIVLKDNKAYVQIRITIKDTYPVVTLARQESDPKSLYFGPYPHAGAVKLVLKTIRKIFPYQSVLHHPKRICLYHHLGLCPCPPIFDSIELKKEYRKNINGIIKILEGGSRKVMRELEKERNSLSKKERYEEALVLQKKIDALSLITQPFHRPVEYDVNPNLRIDIRQKEMEALMEPLNETGYQITSLHRIECYDISNIQGTNATGSMVVLTDGEIDKSQYRRFKIRREWKNKTENDKKEMPNDFAMMQEMLTRRLKHVEWETPDLLVIDGGKGQVSSVLEVLQKYHQNIPLIGLAKREETIIVPNTNLIARNEITKQSQSPAGDRHALLAMTFTEIALPKRSSGLQLIMRIRDEAHRFAVTYHKLLRSKSAFI